MATRGARVATSDNLKIGATPLPAVVVILARRCESSLLHSLGRDVRSRAMAGPGVPSCPLVLGVDGGGTGTTCHAHILDPNGGGRTLATGVGEGGSANANSVGFDVAVRAVTTAALASLRHLGFDDDASRSLLESGVAPLPSSSAFDFPREDASDASAIPPPTDGGSTAPIGLSVRLRAACACLAGCDAPEDRLRWRDALRLAIPGLRADLDPSLLVVDNDAVAALASGSHRPNLPDHHLDDDDAGDPVGVVLVAGTGTVAFAVRADPDRTRARTAGWGPAFDDVGSGHWIGSRALAAVARAVDGRGPKTTLARRVAAAATANDDADANELVRWAYEDGPAPAWDKVASLAPVVFDACEEGDEVARRIVDDAREGLFRSIEALVTPDDADDTGDIGGINTGDVGDDTGDVGAPGDANPRGSIPRVVLCGGLLAETPLGASLAARLRERARELWNGDGEDVDDEKETSRIRIPRRKPAWGAAMIARRAWTKSREGMRATREGGP